MQSKTAFIVIERILIKINYSKISAVVFAMAFITVLIFNIAARVVTDFWINSASYFDVTREALKISNLLTKNMAFSTIFNSF